MSVDTKEVFLIGFFLLCLAFIQAINPFMLSRPRSQSLLLTRYSRHLNVSGFLDSKNDFVILGNQNFVLTNRTRFFVDSPHKSGTTSLGIAFQMMGFDHST